MSEPARSEVGGVSTTGASPLPTIRGALVQFARILRLIRPFWSDYAVLICLGLASIGLGLVAPLLTRALVDQVFPTGDLSLMTLLVVALLLTSTAAGLASAIQSLSSTLLAAQIEASASLMMVNHAQHLPLGSLRRFPVGDLQSRFRDLQSSFRAAAELFDLAFLRSAYLLAIPPLLMWLNWHLALVGLLTTPLVTAVNVGSARYLRRRAKDSTEARAAVDAFTIEAFSNLPTYKSQAAEPELYARTGRLLGLAKDARVSAARLTAGLGAATNVVRAVGTAAYTYVGWRLIIGSDLSLGSFMAFNIYLGFLQGPLNQIISVVSRFQTTAVTLQRFFEVMDAEPEQGSHPERGYPAASPPGSQATLLDAGPIRFVDVTFSYNEETTVLQRVSHEFPPGSTTALVGRSGVGKSTLLKLIAGFETPQRGRISIGHHDLSSVPKRALRSTAVLVWQDAGILRGTLRANLLIGRTGDSCRDEELWETLKVCCMEDFVRDLPEGLDTPVAEWGATLSGGQRQRLALARALLKNAPILLLDEFTAHLDAETEEAIITRISALAGNRTIILASHRPSTVDWADYVLRLEAGSLSGGRDAERSPSSLRLSHEEGESVSAVPSLRMRGA